MSDHQQTPNEETNLLFYRQVSVLNPQRHGDLKVGPLPHYGYAQATNSVPLAGVEFVECCREYPIVFTRGDDNAFSPVAVLGLENRENLFLDDRLAWQGHYVPAFVRRYPFVLGENPDNPDQPWVCLDESCPWLGKETGEPLFIGGQPSVYLQQTLAFLTDYNIQSQRTAAFCHRLGELGLLRQQQAQTNTASGSVYTLNGLWTVDQTSLLELDADKAHALLQAGELAWIYFHLASLGNFSRLAERKAKKTSTPLH